MEPWHSARHLGALSIAVMMSSPASGQGQALPADLDSATLQRVIEDALRGHFPRYILISKGAAASFDITTPYVKIAGAAVVADAQGKPFRVDRITPELLTVTIQVTPPRKSSAEMIRLDDERAAYRAEHGPLANCVDVPVHREVVHAVSALVLWPDGSGVADVTVLESEPPGDLAQLYGQGLMVSVPLEAVRRRATLRASFSNGRHQDLELDPGWLEVPE